jgi:hypothetical protein
MIKQVRFLPEQLFRKEIMIKMVIFASSQIKPAMVK